jgi:hypothetical protein
MKIPAMFNRVIGALNGEGEFNSTAIATTRPSTLPDGSSIGIPFKPYWIQLHDTAYGLEHVRALASARPARALPPEEAYRRAQTVFVQTLRRLIEELREAKWSLAMCFNKDRELERQIRTFLRRRPLVLLAGDDGSSLLINPFTPSATFGLQRLPRGKDQPVMRARSEALTLFIRLVQHPERTRIGRCLRCHRYFYGRPGQKCCPRPRRCGSHLAAITATKTRWRENRKDLIALAQQAIAQWEEGGKRKPWKLWVAKRVGKTEKWVTHAVNQGNLVLPRVTSISQISLRSVKKEKRNAN